MTNSFDTLRRVTGRSAVIALVGASLACSTRDGAPRSDSVATASGPIENDTIANPTGPGSAEPNLVAGPDGRVYLSWLENSDSASALRFAVHDGSRWSEARTIRRGSDFFVNWADFPSLTVHADGRLVAHWLQRLGSGKYAYGVRLAQSRDAGATWSESVSPHRDSSGTEHGFVGLFADGDATGAVWLDGRKYDKAGHHPSNEMMVLTTTLRADGTLGEETRLDERGCDCCQTAVAMTSNGPVVAYRDRSPEEIRDIAVVRRVNGAWTAPTIPNADNWKIAACPVNGPSIAAKGNDVALAWFAAPDDSARVQLTRSSDGGATFSPPVRIDDGTPAGRVGVALLPDGSALTTWIERGGGDTASVRVRRVARDGTRGESRTVAVSSAARASGFPRLVVSGEHVLFAWTVPGKPTSIRTARVALSRLQ